LLAAWWWNKQQNEAVPISLDSQPAPVEERVSSNSSVIDSNIQANSETTDDAAPAETREVVETPAPVAAVESSDVNSMPAPEAAPGVPSVDTGTNVEMAESNAVESEPSEAPSVTVPAPDPVAVVAKPVAGTRAAPARIAPSGTDRLKILVHADTWADVKDANSHQLVYDLLRADSVVDVSGEAPFTVFLGNGHGVEVLFNDTEISITSKVRDDNTARLDIGG